MNIGVGEDEKLPDFIKNDQTAVDEELEEIEEEQEESDDDSRFDNLLNSMHGANK